MNDFARWHEVLLAYVMLLLIIFVMVLHVYLGSHLPNCQEDEFILGHGECVHIDVVMEKYNGS